MTVHLHLAIEKLKDCIVLLGGQVEQLLNDAVAGLENKDAELAKGVIEGDQLVDEQEVDIEEECLKVLALHQPVAVDLRFIMAIFRINSDLERVSDEAVNVAKRALTIISLPAMDWNCDCGAVGRKVAVMLRQSFDALVNRDVEKARAVLKADDEVDAAVAAGFKAAKDELKSGRRTAEFDGIIEYMRVFRHMERMADHCTNIAEDVIYMVEGRIVRHQL